MKQHIKDWALGLFAVLLLSLDIGCSAAESDAPPDQIDSPAAATQRIARHSFGNVTAEQAIAAAPDPDPETLREKSLSDCGSVTSSWTSYQARLANSTAAEDQNPWLNNGRCGTYGAVDFGNVVWKQDSSLHNDIKIGIRWGVERLLEDFVGRSNTTENSSATVYGFRFSKDNGVNGYGRYEENESIPTVVLPLRGASLGLPEFSRAEFTRNGHIKINENAIVSGCQNEYPSQQTACRRLMGMAVAAHEVAHWVGLNHNLVGEVGPGFNACNVWDTRRSAMIIASGIEPWVCQSFVYGPADRDRLANTWAATSVNPGLAIDTSTSTSANDWCDDNTGCGFGAWEFM